MALAPLRALEFYSGIGGMHYALKAVAPTARVVAAFDINDVANDVYAHNFQQRPWQGNIEKVPAGIIDGHQADIWLMAPPCQPYTRRGLQKDSDDWRAASFLRLVGLIPDLQCPPEFLLMENVIGFESSRMRAHLAATLATSGYQLQEFLLSPLQLGIPYSRPRYFGIARRTTADGSAAFQLPSRPDGLPFRQPPSQLLENCISQAARKGHAARQSPPTAPLNAFLVPEPGDDGRCPLGGLLQEVGAAEDGPREEPLAGEPHAEVSDALGSGPAGAEDRGMGTTSRNGSRAWARFMVPDAVCERWGYALDIVAPQSQRCNCFTRTYTRYSKGSGSVLATSNLMSLRDVTALPGLHRGDMDILPANATSPGNNTASRLGPDSLAAKTRKPDRIHCQPSSSARARSCTSGGPLEGNAADGDADGAALPARPTPGTGLPEEGTDGRADTADSRAAAAAEGCRGTLEAAALSGAFPGGVRECISSESDDADGPYFLIGMVLTDRSALREGLCSEGNHAAGPVLRHESDPADGSACGARLSVGDGRELTEASQAVSMELTEWLKTLDLRYFTPREVANLHSFPPQFGFPEHVTLRQRYSLLGNSLSVAVVADLLAYMLPRELQF